VEELEAAMAEVLEERRKSDVFAFEPERMWPGKKASLQIQQIRILRRELGFSLAEGRARLVVLAEAQLLTAEASNALLKILDEPDQALELWRLAQTGRWGAVQRTVEGLRFRCYRDRDLVSRILRLWLLWVRDLLVVKAGLPSSQLANPDRLEGLRKAAAQVE